MNGQTDNRHTDVLFFRQESVAGSVNQATGLPDFEDGPRIGNQSEPGNGLQRVRTIPEINATIVPGGALFCQNQKNLK